MVLKERVTTNKKQKASCSINREWSASQRVSCYSKLDLQMLPTIALTMADITIIAALYQLWKSHNMVKQFNNVLSVFITLSRGVKSHVVQFPVYTHRNSYFDCRVRFNIQTSGFSAVETLMVSECWDVRDNLKAVWILHHSVT